MKRKACPLLVQSDTQPSFTINGESHTRTYFLECSGEKCAAYEKKSGCCRRFQVSVIFEKEENK